MSSIDERFEFACELIRKAGAKALGYFRNFESLEVKSKGVQDMASEADVETEKLIERAVTSRYGEDGFLGEENPDFFVSKPGKGTWIIDPVDGTQPFVNGIASWCVSIAFVEGNRFVFGVVYDPNLDELFAAKAGGGATLNGRLINASAATSLSDGMVGVGYSNRVEPEDTLEPLMRLLRAQGMYLRSGSGALSLAYVAAGRLIQSHNVKDLVVHGGVDPLVGGGGFVDKVQGGNGDKDDVVLGSCGGAGVAKIGEVVEPYSYFLLGCVVEHLLMKPVGVLETLDRVFGHVPLGAFVVNKSEVFGFDGVFVGSGGCGKQEAKQGKKNENSWAGLHL